ncbi:L-lactate dehydrogenase [Mycoplasma cottewii]|uniref:L-lactate dehydrogenase n=1 Tax=Mycoplasma cottewii TaxID=51364 RepID=A0ABY5TWP5_9MOLU|nr:L-lactate dehydrogenase [Mycoplasma cottewii]UWD35103.1 L-lactate dehydrogenase [Mycoplasma cottewii]
MKETSKKVVLVGAGAVGCSFLYAAINQGLAQHYVLIDAFKDTAEGNALDLLDALVVMPNSFSSIKAGNFEDCKDADLIVITAGRPQKPDETRLYMVEGNAKIMKSIANEIKKSGFNGITIVASNPVDIATHVYQKVTGFDPHKVIGSGTTLDSARLKRLLGEKLNVNPSSIDAYLLGEHGDSSVAIWSKANICDKPISDYIKTNKISQKELEEIEKEAIMMAYKIIHLKHATFYGIGACLARIATAVLKDEKVCLAVGAQLNGEYKNSGLYTGVPAIVGANGWEKIIQWDINKKEQARFDSSCETLRKTIDSIKNIIDK